MNPRRVHELMRASFPSFSHVNLKWELLCRGTEDQSAQVLQYLRGHFSEDELLVEVTRKNGGLYPLEEAAALIASAIGSSEIRVANRTFTAFAVVGQPGVVAAWRNSHETRS